MLKKVQVIMLSTKESSFLYKCGKTLYVNTKSLVDEQNQHLYIISDDKIEEGDWCYDIYNYRIVKYSHKIAGQYFVKMVKHTKDYEGYSVDRDSLKKVIATTDTSLKKTVLEHTQYCIDKEEREAIQKVLPQPSQQFIEKYVEAYNAGKPITEVLVEYDFIMCPNEPKCINCYSKCLIGFKLKVNPKDNCITIRRLKDSWNREEVIALIKDFRNGLCPVYYKERQYTEQWIKENL